MIAMTLLLATLAQQPPAPQPFPRTGTQEPARPPAPAPAPPPSQPPSSAPAAPAPTAPSSAVPGESQLGVALYPGAQFLASYDAGRGQRYFLFGTTASFVDVVTFYRTTLKQRGDLVFDAPATHQFDLGRFREETMAFPPSVTVKEFRSQVSEGYPNPRPNAQPSRFPTVIQIVPLTTP
ncbi:MAG: hypothetical protein JSU08_00650 [Acidobacteria bacterium]|nr:hypothetical protein [Acidobacteriota bacterium]